MAYTPVNWQTGDTITADRLNRMDRGWSIDSTQLFSETVTTADKGHGNVYAQLAYPPVIDVKTVIVNFDGTEYICAKVVTISGIMYGDISFAEYPFCIMSTTPGANKLYTKTAGEHTVTVSESTLQTSADFDKARGWGYVTSAPTEVFNETVTAAEHDGLYSAELAYSQFIDASSITVTFDGTEYECPSINKGEYGAPHNDGNPDFSEFPFNLLTCSSMAAYLTTQTAGEHTISVTAPITSMEVFNDFDEAVKPIVDDAIAAIPMPFPVLVTIGITTWAEVNNALKAGRSVFVWNHTTVRNQPDTYEFVATARYTSWTVYTLAVSDGAVVVNTYKAASTSGALAKVTS